MNYENFAFILFTFKNVYITKTKCQISYRRSNDSCYYSYDSIKEIDNYEIIESQVYKIENYLNPEIRELDFDAYTNGYDNLNKNIEGKFKSLTTFNLNNIDLSTELLNLKDLMIGKKVIFSNRFIEQKFINYFDKLEEDFSNIKIGDNNNLLSLLGLIAAINQPKVQPCLGSMVFNAGDFA